MSDKPLSSVEEIARHADALLHDPVLQGILDTMDAEAVRTWRSSPTPAQREESWHRVTVIAELRLTLSRAIEDYKLRTERERKKRIASN